MGEIGPDRRGLLASMAMGAAAAPLPACTAADSAGGKTPKTLSMVAIEAFGAVGDGVTDDTAAFQAAFNAVVAGTTIKLAPGRSYRLTRSLRLGKPIVLSGSAKQETRLLFDKGRYDEPGGQRAALILPQATGKSEAGAQRSSLSGFAMHWIGGLGEMLHGMLVYAPVYVSEVDINGFTADGFRIEAETETLKGNANGSSFTNCSAQGNGGHGFALYGNNANACLFLGARAFDNGGAGFYDASLLGNTYVAAEVDNNKGGGYTSDPALPNNSVYVGCYAEPGQVYRLNSRNLVVGPLGHTDGQQPAMIRSLPSGELFSAAGHIFARDATTAAKGGNADYCRISITGLELMHADGQNVRLRKLLSSNYVDLLNGKDPVLRLPVGRVAGNIDSARPLLPAGFSVGASGQSGILGAGPRPPREGAYAKGALWLNDDPRPQGHVGWVCVTSGSPGVWCGFGKIEGPQR